MDEAKVQEALETARSIVRADGGDMELLDVDPAARTVNLRLVLDGVTCHECVMPRQMLEGIVTDMLRRAVPDVATVAIDDPRERPDYVAPDTH